MNTTQTPALTKTSLLSLGFSPFSVDGFRKHISVGKGYWLELEAEQDLGDRWLVIATFRDEEVGRFDSDTDSDLKGWINWVQMGVCENL